MTNINKTNTYFIKNKIIFDKSIKEVKILENVELNEEIIKKLTIKHDKNIILNNKIIIETIDNLFQEINSKTIKISKPISNFKQIKEKIENYSKNEFKKPENDDYNFIEITSSIEILNQIKKKLEENKDIILNKLSQIIKLDINLWEEEENKIFIKIKEEIKIKENIKEKININLKNIEEEINNKNNNIDFIYSNIKKLSKKKEELLNNSQTKEKLKELENNIETLKNKLENHNYQDKKNQAKINSIHSKIQIINDKIKLKQKKCPNPILLIITLGLIYWTKYSTCNYKKLKLKQKINIIKEKISKDKINILELNEKIKNKTKEEEKIKKQEIEIKKENTEIENKLTIQIAKENKNWEKEEIELEKIKKEEEKLNNELNHIKIELIEIKAKLEEYIKYTTKIINQILDDKKNKIKRNIEQINDIKEKLEKQKTNIKDEFIIVI